jgi:rare lipoprotein A
MRFLLILLLTISLPTLTHAQLVGDTEEGLASYYSSEYEGAETPYGEIYNKNEMVAAHKLFPYNSVVRVKNIENGKTAVVRIIDKGPFIRGRIIELSEAAAAKLGMLGRPTAQVEVTLLSTPDQPAKTETESAPAPEVVTPPAPAPVVVTPQPENENRSPGTDTPAPRNTERPTPAREPTSPAPVPAETTPQAPVPTPTVTATSTRNAVKRTSENKKDLIRDQANFSPGIYKIELLAPPAGNYGVQVGSFREFERAIDKVAQLQKKWFDNILIEKVKAAEGNIYKVILGPFDDQASAKNYASDLKSRYKMDGFTVLLSKRP